MILTDPDALYFMAKITLNFKGFYFLVVAE